jgi:hypothetical protein
LRKQHRNPHRRAALPQNGKLCELERILIIIYPKRMLQVQ